MRRADLLPAVALTAGLVSAAAVWGPADPAARAVAAVAACGLLALAVRRRRPVVALAAVLVVGAIEVVAAPSVSQAPLFLAMMLAVYTLTGHSRGLALSGGLILAASGVVLLQSLSPPDPRYSRWGADLFFTALLVGGPALVGAVVAARRRLAARLHLAAAHLAGARESHVAADIVQERDRVAADADAVVLRAFEELRAPAAVATVAEVTEVERLARRLLTDLRTLLTDLRSGPSSAGPGVEGDGTALEDRVTAVLAEWDAAADGRPRPGWAMASRVVEERLPAFAAAGPAVLLFGTQAGTGRGLVAAGLAALIAVPLGWTRRRPVASAAACVAASVLYAAYARPVDVLDGLPPAPLLIVLPLLAGALVALPGSGAALGLCFAGIGLAVAVDPSGQGAAGIVSSAAVALGAWAAGRVLRSGARTLGQNAETAYAEYELRLAETRRALAAERARLARELHDTIGHAMTAVLMQATAARRVWDSDPALAAQHVLVLRRTLAETQAELRPLVLSLALTGAAATLDLDALADQARRCGLRVRLESPSSAPPALEPTALRIVQESLTNAARHAPGAEVTVRLAASAATLHIEVVNGPAVPARDIRVPAGSGAAGGRGTVGLPGSGHGLRGIAERVAAVGGGLVAGPSEDGGFAVRASLPLPREGGPR